MDNEETTQFDLCRQALESLSQGDAWNFKDTVENILSAKIMDGIETKRFEVGASVFEQSNFSKPGEKRWKQTSLTPEEAAKKFGKENVRVKKRGLRNNDDMVEVFVEEVEELDELSSDTLRNYERKATLYNFKRKGDPEKRKKRSDMIKLAGYKNTRNTLGPTTSFKEK